MRVHVQKGTLFTFPYIKGESVVRNPKGVTVAQLELKLLEIGSRKKEIKFLPKRLRPWLDAAILKVIARAMSFPPLGFEGYKKGLISEPTQDEVYRVDVDAIRGHNLREFFRVN